MRFLALLPCVGCATGWTQSITIGGTFTDAHASVVVALEVSPMLHEPFDRSRPQPTAPLSMPDPHGPPRYLGIAATASVGTEWNPTLGATTFAAVGIDYFPFLFDNGMHVGFGAHVAYAAGALDGVFGVLPRLWFAAPVGQLGGAPLAVGVMLRGQVGLDGGGGGPSLIITRAAL